MTVNGRYEVAVKEAPRCVKCNLPLKAFDATRWECPTCGNGPVLVDGVFPFFLAKIKHVSIGDQVTRDLERGSILGDDEESR